MFRSQPAQKQRQLKMDGVQNAEHPTHNNQALSKQKLDPPIIKVQFGHQIIFTYVNPTQNGPELFPWLWKDQSATKNHDITQTQSSSLTDSPYKKTVLQVSPVKQTPKKKMPNLAHGSSKKIQQKLYSEDEVSLLKKKLQFQYKGLLSKSTETDSVLGIPVIIRFKCKNNGHNNQCPFFHLLQYCREENGKILYRHRAQCSNHTPECILDDENIQYNVIARKLDSSMSVLEDIIRQDYTIKPKQILQVFARKVGENDENFLYDGLQTKSIRRSIKKYFDNAVAKVKNKLKSN